LVIFNNLFCKTQQYICNLTERFLQNSAVDIEALEPLGFSSSKMRRTLEGLRDV